MIFILLNLDQIKKIYQKIIHGGQIGKAQKKRDLGHQVDLIMDYQN